MLCIKCNQLSFIMQETIRNQFASHADHLISSTSNHTMLLMPPSIRWSTKIPDDLHIYIYIYIWYITAEVVHTSRDSNNNEWLAIVAKNLKYLVAKSSQHGISGVCDLLNQGEQMCSCFGRTRMEATKWSRKPLLCNNYIFDQNPFEFPTV